MALSLMAAMAIAQGAKGLADTVVGGVQMSKGKKKFDELTSQPIERGAMASEYGRYLDTVMGGAGRAESLGRQALQRGVATSSEAASRTGDASSAMDVALKAARGEEELGLKGAADIASAYQTIGGVKQDLLDAQRVRKEQREDMMIGMAAGSAEAGRQQMFGGIGSMIDAGAYGLTQMKKPKTRDPLDQLGTMGVPANDPNIGPADTGIFISRNGMNMGGVQKTPSGYNHDNGDDLAVVDKRGQDTGIRIEGDEYIINSEQAESLKKAAMSGNKDLLMRAAIKIFSQPQFS